MGDYDVECAQNQQLVNYTPRDRCCSSASFGVNARVGRADDPIDESRPAGARIVEGNPSVRDDTRAIERSRTQLSRNTDSELRHVDPSNVELFDLRRFAAT